MCDIMVPTPLNHEYISKSHPDYIDSPRMASYLNGKRCRFLSGYLRFESQSYHLPSFDGSLTSPVGSFSLPALLSWVKKEKKKDTLGHPDDFYFTISIHGSSYNSIIWARYPALLVSCIIVIDFLPEKAKWASTGSKWIGGGKMCSDFVLSMKALYNKIIECERSNNF